MEQKLQKIELKPVAKKDDKGDKKGDKVELKPVEKKLSKVIIELKYFTY